MSATRLAALDLARGLAVIAMAIYHFSWDLSWFSLVDWPVAQGFGWRSFAAMIAGSFLFLAGVSLDLAHHEGIRWRAFWRRLAVIVAAAAAVSLVTYFTFANNFVRFGILHCIAAASVIALPFIRLPVWAALAGALLLFTLPTWASSPVLDGQLWLWTGLGTPTFGSVDYVPIAPWAGVTLAGLALSKTFRRFRIWQAMSGVSFSGSAGRLTRWLGRHSLPVYLLHQPVLYGLVWAAAAAGPQVDRAANAFVGNCARACQESQGTEQICEAVCSCTLMKLQADDTWSLLLNDPEDPGLRAQMNSRYQQCLIDPGLEPPTPD